MTTGPMAGILTEAEKKNREHIREQWAQHGILPRLKPWWQMCRTCKTQGLWASQPQQRGICERCWLDTGNPPSTPPFTGDPECWQSHLPPPLPTVAIVSIDWSDPVHWSGGRRQPCRICSKPSFLRDDAKRPCHKKCVEDAVANRRHLKAVSSPT